MERDHIVGNKRTNSPCHYFTYQHTSNTNKKERKERSFPFSHKGISWRLPSLQKKGQNQSHTRPSQTRRNAVHHHHGGTKFLNIYKL
jgi:hypothetical protein